MELECILNTGQEVVSFYLSGNRCAAVLIHTSNFHSSFTLDMFQDNFLLFLSADKDSFKLFYIHKYELVYGRINNLIMWLLT